LEREKHPFNQNSTLIRAYQFQVHQSFITLKLSYIDEFKKKLSIHAALLHRLHSMYLFRTVEKVSAEHKMEEERLLLQVFEQDNALKLFQEEFGSF